MIVAITGNIGSGKSEAAEIFSRYGYVVINADKIGHELYFGQEIKERVLSKFGDAILADGEIDRSKLKEIVFYDTKKLKELNRIIHPAIVNEIRRRVRELKENGKEKIAIEAALIVEVDFREFDFLLALTITHDEQVKRLLKKGKYNKEEINNIIKSQLPQERKMHFADYIVDNSGSYEEFEKNIIKVIKDIEAKK